MLNLCLDRRARARNSRDRRLSARTPTFMLVRERGKSDALWAHDIGLGGMSLGSRQLRWPGTYLDLSFTLPDVPEQLSVGGQVLSLDPMEQGLVGLGVRFCMVPTQVEMAIYRFLDRRRLLWDDKQTYDAPLPLVATPPPLPRVKVPLPGPRYPFAAMLAEAYEALRAKELCRLGFLPTFA